MTTMPPYGPETFYTRTGVCIAINQRPRLAEKYIYGCYDGLTLKVPARLFMWHSQKVLASDHYRVHRYYEGRPIVWVWFKTTYTPYWVEAA